MTEKTKLSWSEAFRNLINEGKVDFKKISLREFPDWMLRLLIERDENNDLSDDGGALAYILYINYRCEIKT